MIFNILDNTTELWMTKYIIDEIFSSGGATLYKNFSDQTVMWLKKRCQIEKIREAYKNGLYWKKNFGVTCRIEKTKNIETGGRRFMTEQEYFYYSFFAISSVIKYSTYRALKSVKECNFWKSLKD